MFAFVYITHQAAVRVEFEFHDLRCLVKIVRVDSFTGFFRFLGSFSVRLRKQPGKSRNLVRKSS